MDMRSPLNTLQKTKRKQKTRVKQNLKYHSPASIFRGVVQKNVLRTTWSVKLHQMVWPNLGFSDLHSAFFFLRSIQLTGDSRKNGFSSKQSDLWSNSWSRLSIHTVSQQLAWPKFGSSPVSRKKKQREKKPHLTTIAAPHSLTHSLTPCLEWYFKSR